jgi:hypothetical protein
VPLFINNCFSVVQYSRLSHMAIIYDPTLELSAHASMVYHEPLMRYFGSVGNALRDREHKTQGSSA